VANIQLTRFSIQPLIRMNNKKYHSLFCSCEHRYNIHLSGWLSTSYRWKPI